MSDDIAMQKGGISEKVDKDGKKTHPKAFSFNPELRHVHTHRKRQPRMEKIGLAVPKDTFEELQLAKDRRGMANVNELLRFYIGQCLIYDVKYFQGLALPPPRQHTIKKK
jgi:hypothetical protein